MKVTPLILEIFFHIYTTPAPIPRPDSAGTKETIEQLLVNDLITEKNMLDVTYTECIYTLTRKGEIWKDAILATPLPVLQYVMPYPYDQLGLIK